MRPTSFWKSSSADTFGGPRRLRGCRRFGVDDRRLDRDRERALCFWPRIKRKLAFVFLLPIRITCSPQAGLHEPGTVGHIDNEPKEVSWNLAPALSGIEALARRVAVALPLIALAVLILPLAWWLSSAITSLMRRVLAPRVAGLSAQRHRAGDGSDITELPQDIANATIPEVASGNLLSGREPRRDL